MIYIENEGALFKGPVTLVPTQVYNFRTKTWEPYKGETPKRQNWGREITEAEAEKMISEGDGERG